MTLPLLAISAWSGTGKTTLLQKVIPLLKTQGIRAGVIKHSHHQMDIDTPGKDSFKLREAGADQVMVANDQRWALMCETPQAEPLNLAALVGHMDASTLDLVLVEGFKDEAIPRIVLWRKGVQEHRGLLTDEHVIAIACDVALATDLPVLDINQPEQVAEFIAKWIRN